jgi:transcriptional regulator with XRE-family HTH domain
VDSRFGERLASLINALGIKKVRFAERIKVDQSYITKLVKGAGQPSDLLIAAICHEYNVNETWLRTGQGDMFTETAKEDQLLAFMGDVMHGAPDFRRHLMSVLSRMTPEEWALLEKKAWELVGEMKKADPEGPAE